MQLVSVIISTFNRSNILKYTIASVLKQEYQSFEIIVVGDHCTDNTAEVVASFNDARISFFNLEKNHGEQSLPNNIGFQKSKGTLIAWLNHDDLWFPDHLSILIQDLNTRGSDLSYSWFIPYNYKELKTDHVPQIFFETNQDKNYNFFVPTSSWLVKRSVVEEVGSWKSAFSLHTIPSQDWLMRAYKKEKNISLVSKLTVIAIQSGIRKDSYKNSDSHEHDYVFDKLYTPGFREELLTYLCYNLSLRTHTLSAKQHLYAIIATPLKTVMRFFKLDPTAIKNKVHYRKKGGLINNLRQIRGLPEFKTKNYD